MLGSLCDSIRIKVLALKAFANLEMEQTPISCWMILKDRKFVVERKLQLQSVCSKAGVPKVV